MDTLFTVFSKNNLSLQVNNYFNIKKVVLIQETA
jgi:hypothetical protein